MEQLSDIEIIDRVTDGDLAAFELLIRRYNGYLYKTGRSYGYNHHDVEDLMQETYIQAYRNLGALQNKQCFKSWLVRIMLNECYRKTQKSSYRREAKANHSISENSIPMFSHNNPSDTEKEVANRELSNIIENALKQVPIDYRLVFTLRELNGMSVHETAEALHISETNVKVRANRAKAMLRREIEKRYSADEIFQFNLVYCDRMVVRVLEAIRKLAR